MPLPAALPPVIPEPFAQNADPANINTIPDTTSGAGLASYDIGFPPITFQPVVAGGIPPEGQDFNGILFAITAHLYYLQSGQRWQFNAAVATAIGGYPIGAIVAMADGSGEWLNVTADNSANPDTGIPGAGGSGWVVLTSVGSSPITGLTGGTVTLTGAQGKSPVIVLSGTLTSNLSIVLPNAPQEWLLVNNCTGAFATTARVGSGVGQTVPQGGYGAPLGVYSIGDGNLYPSVSPLGVPISVPAVANTLVERDNVGNIYVGYINSNSGVDNLSFANVITDFGDGWFRKNSVANFEAALLLQAIGGAVTAGQVPVGAVTQYAPQILASAALTGTPTAPTQAPGTANTTVATTAFVNPGSSVNTNGYRTNPDGSIDQWGSFTTTANAGNLTGAFNIPYSVGCYSFQFTVIAPSGTGGAGSRSSDCWAAPNANNFFIRQGASSNTSITIQWRAVGK